MHSLFKVTCDYIAGEKIYRVFRNIDIEEPDHSGNREYREGIFHSYEEAEEAAEYWNNKEEFNGEDRREEDC